jgi:hypothetical protein
MEQPEHPEHLTLKSRLAELSLRAGNYTLVFLSFAVVTAATLLQIPTDAHDIVVPNRRMIWALKVWMVSAIPLILAILPVTEIVDPNHLHRVAKFKFTLNWLGMGLCILGIIFFLFGISY